MSQKIRDKTKINRIKPDYNLFVVSAINCLKQPRIQLILIIYRGFDLVVQNILPGLEYSHLLEEIV